MTRKYAHKIDGNQTEIVAALRQTGHHVVVLSRVGGGVPDLLVARAGAWWLCELKAGRGKLGAEQVMFIREAQGPVIVARTAQEAIDKGGMVVTRRWTWVQTLDQLKDEQCGPRCPRDTDGDGNCGRPACPVCGPNVNGEGRRE